MFLKGILASWWEQGCQRKGTLNRQPLLLPDVKTCWSGWHISKHKAMAWWPSWVTEGKSCAVFWDMCRLSTTRRQPVL